MFSTEEIIEFVEEYKQTNDFIDPLIDQYGPHLYEEVDLQEWKKLCRLYSYKEIDNNQSNFYIGSNEKNKSTTKSKKNENTKVKTRIQITLKRKGQNIRGHTGNFVVHGIKTETIIESLSELINKYPKTRKSEQTVRVQLTEYITKGNSYIPNKGGNINLCNAEIKSVINFIKYKLIYLGFSLQNGKWKNKEFLNNKQYINIPYNKEIHHGFWCLCHIKNGKSWVLSISKELNKVINEQNEINRFTYILNPNGIMHRWTNRRNR